LTKNHLSRQSSAMTKPPTPDHSTAGNGGESIAENLLSWYDRHARRLPWRVGPVERARGLKPDPYRVWLSEVMLQQTVVAAVKPYFERFAALWPTIGDLAAADRDDIMKAWAGLGYYARARNLHACAQAVMNDHGGRFPDSAADLRRLPGIGTYTAAAIAAIAFDRREPVVDGNIERVIARLFAIETPLPAAKAAIRDIQARLTPAARPGDYAQAVMDLGASLCTPKRPACRLCPLADACAAHARGEEERFPRKAERADRPTRYGIAYVAVRADGAVLLRRRPDDGLLGGMVEPPVSAWTSRRPEPAPPLRGAWRRIAGTVVHVFTHFRLELIVYCADFPTMEEPPAGCWWAAEHSLPGAALPSVMRKAIEAARPGATRRDRKRETTA
jgi:A/G-specific adenine glycosylase